MLALLAESESIADDALQAPRPICRTGDPHRTRRGVASPLRTMLCDPVPAVLPDYQRSGESQANHAPLAHNGTRP